MFSQNIDRCKEIVKIATQALNTKSTVELEKHLASDFEIAGRKGKIARAVLKQLLAQLGDSIESYNETNTDITNGFLTIEYAMNYRKIGKKTAKFVFNKDNKLKELELIKIEVKTLSNSKTSIKKPEESTITVPFFMIGKLIAIEVILNNKKRTFLLDTGAPKVILNSKYIEKGTKNKRMVSSSMKGAGGNISGMDIQPIKKLDLRGIIIENQDVITMELSHLEKELETDIELYGLIGYDLIKDYDLLFDYKNSELTLIKPDFYPQYKNKQLSKNKLTKIPFELKSHIPVFKAQIAGKEFSFGVDSGAETNLMDDDLLGSMSKLLKNKRTSNLTGADKKRTEVIKGAIKKTIIGGKRFKKMQTLFNDISHLNKGYKLKLDGLMGYELLSKQKTLISYQRKQMIFIE